MTRSAFTASRIGGLCLMAALAGLAGAISLPVVAALFSVGFADYGTLFARGLWITILITTVTFLAGFILALLLTIVDLTGRWGRHIVHAFVSLFRNTPLIAQLYLVYYGAGELAPHLRALNLWWLFRDPLPCVLLVFTLNTAAYQVHVLIGAIRSLPEEQSAAARALGLSATVTFWKVLLPQAFRVAIRPLGNELTKMLKASSIASAVAVLDLLGTATLVYSETLNFDVYIVTAILYVATVEVIQRMIARAVGRPPRQWQPASV